MTEDGDSTSHQAQAQSDGEMIFSPVTSPCVDSDTRDTRLENRVAKVEDLYGTGLV